MLEGGSDRQPGPRVPKAGSLVSTPGENAALVSTEHSALNALSYVLMLEGGTDLLSRGDVIEARSLVSTPGENAALVSTEHGAPNRALMLEG